MRDGGRGARDARIRAAALVLALSASVPAMSAAQTIAIVGGRVLPVSGPAIDHGTVLIRDGKIAAVGANVSIPADAQRVDATGTVVTPGLVDAATELGLSEIGAVQATSDFNARGRDSVYAAFQPWLGLNPASPMIPEARNHGGVTTALVGPRGGLVGGQTAMIELDVGAIDPTTMVLRGPSAMVAYYGPGEGVGVHSRGDLLNKLQTLIDDTRWYAQHHADYDRGATRKLAASGADLAAMLPVAEGREPLVVSVDRASDILAMLDFAKKNSLKLVIEGGDEAWKVADRLAAAHVPVLAGAESNIPYTFAQLGARQENVGLLQKAGVPVAIIGNGAGDEEVFNVRNLRYEAGNAVAYGANWDAALRAITLTPAEIFGVADRVGSLTPGKDANVVVWSGDPFEFASEPVHVYVRGKEDTMPTRQDLLEQRYKNLPPDYKKPQ